MHAVQFLFPFLLLLLTTDAHILVRRSEVNGKCTGESGNPGVCIPTSDCTEGGGKYISDACPGTPNEIKCCTKTACGSNNKGDCRFTSSCASGITETNKCPGPANFKCCMPEGSGYPTPDFPSISSGCKQVAIDGAKAIVNAFPGKIKSIGCIRKCDDPSSSDHCTGMATDMMVADGGEKVAAGEPIAEWVMNHAGNLDIDYVMWGQRIWSPSRDSVKPWSQWRYQSCTVIPNCVNGDRGDNTANHWDHVHISYK